MSLSHVTVSFGQETIAFHVIYVDRKTLVGLSGILFCNFWVLHHLELIIHRRMLPGNLRWVVLDRNRWRVWIIIST